MRVFANDCGAILRKFNKILKHLLYNILFQNTYSNRGMMIADLNRINENIIIKLLILTTNNQLTVPGNSASRTLCRVGMK